MIISLIILGILILNIYRGFRDGLVYEFIRIISYVVGWMIAMRFAHSLGGFLNRFLGADSVLINGVSFLIIFLVSVMILKEIGRIIDHVTDFPNIHLLNSLGGVVIGALVGYLIVLILLSIGLELPSTWMQAQYVHSPVAQKIVNNKFGSHSVNNWLK